MKYNKTIEIQDYKERVNGILLNRLTLRLDNNKRITLNVPLDYVKEYNEGINVFLKSISFNNIKQEAIQQIEENCFDNYTNEEFDNLIIYSSNFSSYSQIKSELNKTKSLYISFNEDYNYEIILMLIKDFIDKNKEYIDEYIKDDNRIKIVFSNNKSIEIVNTNIINSLNNTLEQLLNNLIDIKVKKLKLNNNFTKTR